jgi:hypothetical protein
MDEMAAEQALSYRQEAADPEVRRCIDALER